MYKYNKKLSSLYFCVCYTFKQIDLTARDVAMKMRMAHENDEKAETTKNTSDNGGDIGYSSLNFFSLKKY